MNADGSNQVRLTNFENDITPDNVNVTKPTWSPKGDRIAFHRRVSAVQGERGHLQVYTMNAEMVPRVQRNRPGNGGLHYSIRSIPAPRAMSRASMFS